MAGKKIKLTLAEEAALRESGYYPWQEKKKRMPPLEIAVTLSICAIAIAAPIILILTLGSKGPFLMACTADTVLLFAAIIKSCQVDAMRRLTGYFKDENGCFYKVVITKGASSAGSFYFSDENGLELKDAQVGRDMQAAQDINTAFYYVRQYKAGRKDWNPWTGGEAKIVRLKDLRLLRSGRRADIYSFEGCCGEGRRIRIRHEYTGLKEAAERETAR